MHKISTCSEMVRYVDEVGFLPLLPIGITGWSADDVVDSDCRYVALPEGGWEWALWRWKGEIIRESGCAYGKFFDKKAAFVSKEWWPTPATTAVVSSPDPMRTPSRTPFFRPCVPAAA